HLEPLDKKFRVRFRVDGVLQEMQAPPKRLQSAIVSRLKIMTGSMSIAEKRLPQDGRIQVKIKRKPIDLRVSTIPTNHGESVVMRLLDKSSLVLGLPELGFLSDDQETFERLIQLPDGILLVTGPTGSGKTSTLYANDAPTAIPRLIDIGVQPFLVASSLRAIMAQRLVRRLCSNCKQPAELSESEMRALRVEPGQLRDAQVMHGKGCDQCRGTGYKGRMGIFEIFVLDDEVRHMINKR